MLLTRREFPILIANASYLPVFSILAWRSGNHEFLMYIVVVLLVGGLILWKQRRVQFSGVILWGLTLWGFLHMAGGNIRVGEIALYGLTLVPGLSQWAAESQSINTPCRNNHPISL